jgi:hypothetical protein
MTRADVQFVEILKEVQGILKEQDQLLSGEVAISPN